MCYTSRMTRALTVLMIATLAACGGDPGSDEWTIGDYTATYDLDGNGNVDQNEAPICDDCTTVCTVRDVGGGMTAMIAECSNGGARVCALPGGQATGSRVSCTEPGFEGTPVCIYAAGADVQRPVPVCALQWDDPRTHP